MAPALQSLTLLARSPRALLSQLCNLPSAFTSPQTTLLFTLSSNTPIASLSPLVSQLTSLSTHSAGCISASFKSGYIQCSVAAFDSTYATVFRSTIAGREAPQVGRWHAFRDKDAAHKTGLGDEVLEMGEGVDWEAVWGRSTLESVLPEDLRKLEPDDVNSVIYFTDSASEGLSNALTALPNAVKLGLVASSTPFITGRPVTLFHNGEVHSHGAVGIAFTRPQPSPKLALAFEALDAITPKMTVTKSEGNLVNSLDDKNPSRLLLDAIQKRGIEDHDKGDTFYLGTFNTSETLSQVYHITSGDPGRGTIALESHAAPFVGTQAQIFHRAKKSALPTSPAPPSMQSNDGGLFLKFTTTSSDEVVSPKSESGEPADETLEIQENEFRVSSENGFMLSRGKEPAWRCTVVGGSAQLTWSKTQ